MAQNVFSARDRAQLAARGITPEEALRQLALLRTPPPSPRLDRPCTVSDGILRLDSTACGALIEEGDRAAAAGRVMKFVPASGAATRMFRDLVTALQDARPPGSRAPVRALLEALDRLPFSEELRRRSGVQGTPVTEGEERALLRTLLDDMRYAELPKGLIPFHRAGRPRTAFEEHLLDAARYTRAADGTCHLHFTVAPDTRDRFEQLLAEVGPATEGRHPGLRLQVDFSEQHPSTDTLALGEDGQPFRTAAGSLLLRPAGHGALLVNLQETGGDIVVIKNIDNVLPDEANGEAVRWKRLLIGMLAQVQAETFDLIARCSAPEADARTVAEALDFAAARFARVPAPPLLDHESRRRFACDALDRPLRICGVVRNDGEPGGAPFWVRGADGRVSIQIVEASQVDPDELRQTETFGSATHFNPVDLVCGLRRWTGDAFALHTFVDPSTVFITAKSYEGRPLRALERPGLWNGAMAGWNTLCVEVPASTFAPVKTVFDLLRPEHQLPAGRTSSAFG